MKPPKENAADLQENPKSAEPANPNYQKVLNEQHRKYLKEIKQLVRTKIDNLEIEIKNLLKAFDLPEHDRNIRLLFNEFGQEHSRSTFEGAIESGLDKLLAADNDRLFGLFIERLMKKVGQ